VKGRGNGVPAWVWDFAPRGGGSDGKNRLFFSRVKLKAFTPIYADTIRNYFIVFGVEFSRLQEAGDSREK
jgi:hypothetical protein